MYEFRKNMGDVCKDVSSSIEERKDVLSEEQQHYRDSEPRQDETKFHLSDTTELEVRNPVALRLIKQYKDYNPSVEFFEMQMPPRFCVHVRFHLLNKPVLNFRLAYSMEEIYRAKFPKENYIFEKAVRFIDEEIKKYI